jgi:hypothetical protein
MAISLVRQIDVSAITNRALSDIMRRFKELNPVSLHKEVQISKDTLSEWSVYVAPIADKTWHSTVLWYYGKGKYNRSWTSSVTTDPMWHLYKSITTV